MAKTSKKVPAKTLKPTPKPTPKPATPALASAVAGVIGVFVVVDPKGQVLYIDGPTRNVTKRAALLQGIAPYSVAISIATTPGQVREVCIITDSAGNVWEGSPRAERDFTKIFPT